MVTHWVWLTLNVEMPPFQSRVHMSYSWDVVKKIQPGLVIPVRIHPAKPDKVLIATDEYNQPLP